MTIASQATTASEGLEVDTSLQELDATSPDTFLGLNLEMRSEIADLMKHGSHWLELIEEHEDTRKARLQIHEGLTQAVMVQSSLEDIIQDATKHETTMSSVQRKSKLDAARLNFDTLRAAFNELKTLPDVIIVEDQRAGAQPSASSSGASAAAPDPASSSGTPTSKRARLSTRHSQDVVEGATDVVVEIDD